MFDIKEIKVQLREFFVRQVQTDSPGERISRISGLMKTACGDLERWKQILGEVSARWPGRKPSLLVAGIVDNPYDCRSIPEFNDQYTCLASDGSQILPSRHEMPELSLIHTGEIRVSYRTGTPPILRSKVKLLTPDHLAQSAPDPGERPTFEQFVLDERSVGEFEGLATLAAQSPIDSPALALQDGSLIFWNLEDRPAQWRSHQLERLKAAFSSLHEKKTPVVGYISRPGSRDLVNALAIMEYFLKNGYIPDKPAEVLSFVPPGEETPVFSGLTDRHIYQQILGPGQRSPWLASSSHILEDYSPDHRIFFCYLRVWDEIARLEVPHWACEDADFIHGAILDQCRKGKGYPITLSEAHEKAVVRGPDRELFYRLAAEEWRKANQSIGIKTPLSTRSAKQRSKARPVF